MRFAKIPFIEINSLYSYKSEAHCMNRNEVELDEVNVRRIVGSKAGTGQGELTK